MNVRREANTLDKFKVSNLYEKLKGVDPDYKMPKKLIIQQSSVNIP